MLYDSIVTISNVQGLLHIIEHVFSVYEILVVCNDEQRHGNGKNETEVEETVKWVAIEFQHFLTDNSD